jgi:hypothetical protein
VDAATVEGGRRRASGTRRDTPLQSLQAGKHGLQGSGEGGTEISLEVVRRGRCRYTVYGTRSSGAEWTVDGRLSRFSFSRWKVPQGISQRRAISRSASPWALRASYCVQSIARAIA